LLSCPRLDKKISIQLLENWKTKSNKIWCLVLLFYEAVQYSFDNRCFLFFFNFAKQYQNTVGSVNFGFSNLVYEVRMLYINPVPWFANKRPHKLRECPTRCCGTRFLTFLFSFYYYNNIEAREILSGTLPRWCYFW